MKTVEVKRDALLKPATDEAVSPAAMLEWLKGIGPETATVLWAEQLPRRISPQHLTLAIVLGALWANMHGSFFLGPLIAGGVAATANVSTALGVCAVLAVGLAALLAIGAREPAR